MDLVLFKEFLYDLINIVGPFAGLSQHRNFRRAEITFVLSAHKSNKNDKDTSVASL